MYKINFYCILEKEFTTRKPKLKTPKNILTPLDHPTFNSCTL